MDVRKETGTILCHYLFVLLLAAVVVAQILGGKAGFNLFEYRDLMPIPDRQAWTDQDIIHLLIMMSSFFIMAYIQ
jgi:hypothetical protein